jgi:penicillin-binding protein 2
VPRFDPNDMVADDPEAWARLNRHPGRPLFNRLIAAALPPGSVFKALTAVAFVQSGLVSANETYYCQGYLRRPDQLRCLIFSRYGHGHGDTSLVGAIKESCNVFFFHHAERIGPRRIAQWAEAFGFGRPTGIDLPGESGGFLPTPDNVEERQGHPWRRGDTPRLAIGQASLTVTPLQVARLMAAIANGGTLVTPHLVRATSPAASADQEPPADVQPVQPAKKIDGVTAAKLRPIRDGLRAVVQEPGGTGYRTVHLEAVAVAGKTGTAETGAGRDDHAWFAGYAPADRPRVAFAIVLEHGGSGGAEAGPVAKALIEKMLELGYFGDRGQYDPGGQ